eukprot:1692622-Rhodomonas_salina.4
MPGPYVPFGHGIGADAQSRGSGESQPMLSEPCTVRLVIAIDRQPRMASRLTIPTPKPPSRRPAPRPRSWTARCDFFLLQARTSSGVPPANGVRRAASLLPRTSDWPRPRSAPLRSTASTDRQYPACLWGRVPGARRSPSLSDKLAGTLRASDAAASTAGCYRSNRPLALCRQLLARDCRNSGSPSPRGTTTRAILAWDPRLSLPPRCQQSKRRRQEPSQLQVGYHQLPRLLAHRPGRQQCPRERKGRPPGTHSFASRLNPMSNSRLQGSCSLPKPGASSRSPSPDHGNILEGTG